MINQNNIQEGFILLMSSIIISAVLVTVVLSVSFGGFVARFNILDSYNKESSLALAEACAEIAILSRVENSNYTGDEYFTIGSEECRVRPITVPGDVMIETTASKSGVVSNIIVNLDAGDLSVKRWRETPVF